MRLARIQTPDGPRPVVADGDDWAVVTDHHTRPLVHTGERVPHREATLLAPCEPRVVFGMLHNGAPGDREIPMQAFQKSSRTVVGPGDPIRVDAELGQVNAEGELALVVGKLSRRLTPENVADAILGWTIGNDVTAVGQAPLDDKSTQVKNGDGYTPIGPWIETELPDVLNLAMTMYRNGEQVAEANTAQLAWNPFETLAYLSRYTTLGPGDVVLTGSPATFFPIVAGDECRCEIQGLGALLNPVVADA